MLKEALDRYEREVTPRKKSAADEPYKLRNWKESSLADRELAFIHGKHVAEWRDGEIDRGSAPATVRRKLALLSQPRRSDDSPSPSRVHRGCVLSASSWLGDSGSPRPESLPVARSWLASR